MTGTWPGFRDLFEIGMMLLAIALMFYFSRDNFK